MQEGFQVGLRQEAGVFEPGAFFFGETEKRQRFRPLVEKRDPQRFLKMSKR
jgi:hypothetical protein